MKLDWLAVDAVFPLLFKMLDNGIMVKKWDI